MLHNLCILPDNRKNGFVHKGTEKYEHLPFTVGKAEFYIYGNKGNI